MVLLYLLRTVRKYFLYKSEHIDQEFLKIFDDLSDVFAAFVC